MDQSAIQEAIHTNTGFAGTLGSTVLAATRDDVRLRLDAGPELQQHFGGPHAAVIFGLGETTAFCLLLAVFGDLLTDGVAPLVKDVQISYTGIARGPLLATARLTGDEAGAREVFARKGGMRFDVEVVFRTEADDTETARATYRMGIRRF